jgi:hypothetical protein
MKAKCTGVGNGGGGCGAELLVEWGDLYTTESGGYGDNTDYYVTFRCTQCSVETDLPDSRQPDNVSDLPEKIAWLRARQRAAKNPKGQ